MRANTIAATIAATVAAVLATAASTAVSVGVGGPAAAAPGAAAGQTALAPSTRADLDTVLHGEAFAWAKYTLYGESAQRAGRPAAATLWAATARVERGEHLAEHADLVGLVGSDVDNLKAAVAGEDYETRTMYPTFARQAARQGAHGAAALFTEIGADEARHRDAFAQALRVLTTGKGTTPAPWTPDPYRVRPGRALNHGRTATNLLTAMHGEALASVKYDLFAAHARAGGHTALANLFASTAQVEFREHFSEEAQRVGLVSSVRSNLRESASGEHEEATQMYPAMARRAAKAGDKAVAAHFLEVAKDEAKHSAAFTRELRR